MTSRKEGANTETYTYALVKVTGFDSTYSYISDDPKLKVGDFVLVPFGRNNELRQGEVVNLKECTAENAPYPVEKTKRIIRLLFGSCVLSNDKKKSKIIGCEEYWYCPIYDREIDSGLCWEVSNIGNDSLGLYGEEYPPCGWEKANKICGSCIWYEEWGRNEDDEKIGPPPEEVLCPIVDHMIEDIVCIVNSDCVRKIFKDSVVPDEFKQEKNWRGICGTCKWHNY